MYQKTIIKIVVLSAALAFHKLFFEPAYLAYLAAKGVTAGFGEIMFGYIITVTAAFLLSYVLTRPMKKVTSG